VDEEEGDFLTIAAVGENAKAVRGARIPLGEGVPGLSARERRPLLLCDVDTAQMSGMPRAPECTLAVPMFAGETLHGVLIIENRVGGGKFSQDDLAVIANLATLSSAALRQHESTDRVTTMLEEVLRVFASVVEMRDPYSRGHALRVARYCEEMARALHLDEDTIGTLRRAAYIHDLGKIAIPESLLRKEGRFTDDETTHVRNHICAAESLLLDLPELAPMAPIVRHHHERCDGSGYPDGLTGDAIPLTTHILIVANAFDVMTSDRSYRQATSLNEALKELKSKIGTWYDARAVEVLVNLDPKLLKATGDNSGASATVKEQGAASISIRD
jgi:polar amino acid transport system substrate-binding protein